MRDDWTAFSVSQLHVIASLSFAMPLHASFGVKRLGLSPASIAALERNGFLRRISMFEEGATVPIPFLTLTQRGERLRRDYIRWHRSVRRMVGSLPPAMLKIAELPL